MPAFEELVSTLVPKERIWSFSFSRLCLGFCAGLSYRQTTDLLNSVLHRPADDLLKVRTLTDFVERTGDKIQDYLMAVSENILKDNHFEPGTAQAGDVPPVIDVAPKPVPSDEQRLWDDEIARKVEEINEQRESREQIRDLERFPCPESPQDKCCYISIDDIWVKHQKETRKDGGVKSTKNVGNTVIHIQNDGGSYYLTASGMDNAFRMLMAFLLSNNLMLDNSLVFLADGAQNIRNYIEMYFSSHPYTLILDWYHLKKKCKELVSSSLKGTKDQKKEFTQSLLRMLWVGNVNEAICYLNELDGSQIKSSYWLGELTGYLDRKKKQIVCYALRHELGLRISSNRVEKANDLLVARRQKHNGMSWSFEGSRSLASTIMVMQNNDMDLWLRTHSLPFVMPTKAAA